MEMTIKEFCNTLNNKLDHKKEEGYLLMVQQDDKKSAIGVDITCISQATPEILCSMIGNIMENNELLRASFILSVFSFIGIYDETENGFLDAHIEMLQSLKK